MAGGVLTVEMVRERGWLRQEIPRRAAQLGLVLDLDAGERQLAAMREELDVLDRLGDELGRPERSQPPVYELTPSEPARLVGMSRRQLLDRVGRTPADLPPCTGDVVTLRATEPEPLTLGPFPVEQAERVREEATGKVSADLRFTWTWAPDRCVYQPARPFGSGDSSHRFTASPPADLMHLEATGPVEPRPAKPSAAVSSQRPN